MGVICVTGSSSGIGAATKAALDARGDRVIGVARRNADVIADLSTKDGRAAAIDGVLAAADGPLSGFVPSAGVGGLTSPEMTVRLNYFSVIAVLEGLRSSLATAGDASVVLVSSSTAATRHPASDDVDAYLAGDEEAAVRHFADSGYLAYPAGKLALIYWMRANAPGWLADGIRINAIAPGVIDTPMTRSVEEVEGAAEALRQLPIPVGRWGRPEEVAATIMFLLSPAAKYILGQTLIVDGGTDVVLNPRRDPAVGR